MATPVIMPKQGQSVESCIIAKWHKKAGDKVNIGDVLFTYETDKATFDEDAKTEGIILDIFFQEGDDVPCLTNVCVIGQQGEDASAYDPNVSNETQKPENQDTKQISNAENNQKESANADKKENTDVVGTNIASSVVEEEGRLKISPRARNLAEREGVDPRFASPTGPQGRIIERDIVNVIENGPIFTKTAKFISQNIENISNIEGTGIGGRITSEDLLRSKNTADEKQDVKVSGAEISYKTSNEPLYYEEKLTNIRKVIAKAMHNSITSTCQLTLNSSFDASEILQFREKIKQNKDAMGLSNITLNDIILYAVSRTLKSNKYLNAHFLDDKILLFNNVHIGVAVDTDRGLMVPTVMFADIKSLNQISAEVKQLAQECQKGTISPDKLKGASFTVTNLGAFGVESFTPVLNPPQVAILGVNTIVQRARENEDGSIGYYPAMTLSLTFDHRAVDGAPAARFLKDLKNNLENFTMLLLK